MDARWCIETEAGTEYVPAWNDGRETTVEVGAGSLKTEGSGELPGQGATGGVVQFVLPKMENGHERAQRSQRSVVAVPGAGVQFVLQKMENGHERARRPQRSGVVVPGASCSVRFAENGKWPRKSSEITEVGGGGAGGGLFSSFCRKWKMATKELRDHRGWERWCQGRLFSSFCQISLRCAPCSMLHAPCSIPFSSFCRKTLSWGWCRGVRRWSPGVRNAESISFFKDSVRSNLENRYC